MELGYLYNIPTLFLLTLYINKGKNGVRRIKSNESRHVCRKESKSFQKISSSLPISFRKSRSKVAEIIRIQGRVSYNSSNYRRLQAHTSLAG